MKHKIELLDAIPELMEGREPLWLYPRNQGEVHLSCNNFEEIEIVVLNTDSIDDAKEKASEFLRHLKSNGYEWWD